MQDIRQLGTLPLGVSRRQAAAPVAARMAGFAGLPFQDKMPRSAQTCWGLFVQPDCLHGLYWRLRWCHQQC
jgi:hypothetical protein